MPNIKLPITERGAVVDLLVGLSTREAQVLRRAQREIPQEIALQGVIDTGARSTVIDADFVSRLRLDSAGSTSVLAVGATVPLSCDQFNVCLWVVHPSLARGKLRVAKSLFVLRADLRNSTGDDALIGQDLLAQWRFLYNGPARAFSLEF